MQEKLIRIKKGLDISLPGAPEQTVYAKPPVSRVALIAADYPGLRPSLEVAEGERVNLGQPLFRDRRDPRICVTSCGSGRVTAVHRGEKRALLSVEIALAGEAEETCATQPKEHLGELSREEVQQTLLGSGLWTALRQRPFDRIADPDTPPDALFITAVDTQPLAVDPALVIAQRRDDFSNGLKVLTRLTDGPVYLCQAPKASLPLTEGIRIASFAGPHPAGLPGTHIHELAPIVPGRRAWHIGYQDVIAAGHLFTTGRLLTERIIALGGIGLRQPRLVRTRLGASIAELLAQERTAEAGRILSGSVLNGRVAEGPLNFLGRYHLQVTSLAPTRRPRPLGWILPGDGALWLPRFLGRRCPHSGTPATNGPQRAIFPLGTYEKVWPFDLPIPFLLRALAASDIDEALELGCLGFVEEDLALCTFVCPGKNDFGQRLREILNQLEQEG